MALKLGKCRLCLKLGDFFSIFTVDNTTQLSEMAMECARIKIYDGDGLPDKICSECVQKLSGAYIFKQQCERADAELRRNYAPPPGFSITPPPPNRQSSDSAFSSIHTDFSNQTKATSSIEKITPSKRRKRSRESNDNSSVGSRSQDYRTSTSSKRVEELRKTKKRPRCESPNVSVDSDFDNDTFDNYSDSDEPSALKCLPCNREFKSGTSLSNHMRTHKNDKDNGLGKNAVVDIPKANVEDAKDSDEKLTCDKCSKTFKLKIMLNRHKEVCGKKQVVSPQKQLLISLEPIDAVLPMPSADDKRINCEMCTARFKTHDYLEKHMKIVHAAIPKRKIMKSLEPPVVLKVSVPCLYCHKLFNDYLLHNEHFKNCPQRDSSLPLTCPICDNKIITRKQNYVSHLRMHFFPRDDGVPAQSPKSFQCKMCSVRLPSQEQLITHLAGHMSNIEDGEDSVEVDVESRASTIDDGASNASFNSSIVANGPYKCIQCDKSFKYRKALETHQIRCHNQTVAEVKTEPPDKQPTSAVKSTPPSLNITYKDTDSESSPGEGDDLTCEICERQFSYKRLLIHHKRTKHNMSSGTKRAKINLKDCMVRCLICDIEMQVSSINEHNQKHIKANTKPRNIYTCAECSEQFKSCSTLANHIKIVHRLKQSPPKAPEQFEGTDLADFCEVVVTKTEPLDALQSHNDFEEVPIEPAVDLAGFTCHICDKKLKTLISLKRHVNWHTNVGNKVEKNLECFVCNEKFRFQCHYRLHMRGHYTDTNLDPKHLTCQICGRRSKHLRAAKAHMNFHKQTRFKNKDYQCSICKRVFQYRKVYLSHMAIHYKRGEGQDAIVGDIRTKQPTDGFQCPQCGKVCDSENSLKCHVIWHKSKSSLYGSRYECTMCNVQYTNKKRLEVHVRTHYEDENGPYKCTVCGKGYIDEDYFRRHVKGHNFDHQSHKKRIEKLRKDKIKCPICNRFYPDLIKLIRHLRRTHPDSKMIKPDPDAPPQNYYPCKLCAKVFLDERRLQHHEERHLRKPQHYKCKFCGKNFASLKNHRIHIKGHLTQKYTDDPLKCPQCSDMFIRGYDLHYHLKDVHGIHETWIADRSEQPVGPLKEFQCSVCQKVLATKGNFERHIDYHNSLRCNYCFEYFNNLKFLEGHLAYSCDKKKLIGDTEIFPKKVKCHICYKAFHLQVKLDCHLRTQHKIKVSREVATGKQEIVCDFCFRVFENDYALTMHKIYHRSVGYYGCIYCPRKFNNMTNFNKHKNHHFSQLNVDNPTKCEHCDETFVPFRDFIYHMRDVHGDDKDWIVMPKESIEEKCNICNKTFYNLQRHLGYHEENRCKKCGEYFTSRADYDSHLCAIESDDEVDETNTNDVRPKYIECTFCFKPITKSQTKKKHDHLHTVSGAISCRFCKLKFKTLTVFNIHAFSHRSRKYVQKPIKCRICKEKFVKYGPFIKHMKIIHKSTKKVHYRAMVRKERCVVCGDNFPNLHNHYRCHMQNQCQLCHKYFASSKLFSQHECDKEDSDPTKVFTSDENLHALIKSYVPKDEKDDEKFYGYTDDEEDDEEDTNNVVQNEDSQNSMEFVQPFVISDVLSLYEKKEELLAAYKLANGDKQKCDTTNEGENGEDSDVDIVNLSDDDDVHIDESGVIVIDIDD